MMCSGQQKYPAKDNPAGQSFEEPFVKDEPGVMIGHSLGTVERIKRWRNMTPSLIVDTHIELRHQLVRLLEQAGHCVTAGATISQATDLLEEHVPDLLATNVVLTDGSGASLAKRAEAGGAKTLIYLILAVDNIAARTLFGGAHWGLVVTFISYAQAKEDIHLLRALSGVHHDVGFYIDLGAWDPEIDSVTKLFYDAGWRGINVEPSPKWFPRLLEQRPRDINLQVAVSETPGE